MVVHVKKEQAQLQGATALVATVEKTVKLTSISAQTILASLEYARKALVQIQAVHVTWATLVIHATSQYHVFQIPARMVALVYPSLTVILYMPVNAHHSTLAMTVKQQLVVESILTVLVHCSAKLAVPVIHTPHTCLSW